MKEWCMTHPWMTFIILIGLVVNLENVLVVINNRLKIIEYELKLKHDKQKEGD